MFFVAAIGVLVYVAGQKGMAQYLGFETEFSFWGVKRFWFTTEANFPKEMKFLGRQFTMNAFPIGILIATLLMLLSNGRLFFPAILGFALVISHTKRLGKGKFLGATELEEGKIALAGPLALLLLVVLFQILNGRQIFDEFIFVYSMMAVFQMLPLPGLDGFKVLIGSPLLYIFSALFILLAALLLHFLGIITGLLIAAIVALMVFFLYLYYRVYK